MIIMMIPMQALAEPAGTVSKHVPTVPTQGQIHHRVQHHHDHHHRHHYDYDYDQVATLWRSAGLLARLRRR